MICVFGGPKFSVREKPFLSEEVKVKLADVRNRMSKTMNIKINIFRDIVIYNKKEKINFISASDSISHNEMLESFENLLKVNGYPHSCTAD